MGFKCVVVLLALRYPSNACSISAGAARVCVCPWRPTGAANAFRAHTRARPPCAHAAYTWRLCARADFGILIGHAFHVFITSAGLLQCGRAIKAIIYKAIRRPYLRASKLYFTFGPISDLTWAVMRAMALARAPPPLCDAPIISPIRGRAFYRNDHTIFRTF
ncbi:unnamed protein product, partial [Iphiclides podalirius]